MHRISSASFAIVVLRSPMRGDKNSKVMHYISFLNWGDLLTDLRRDLFCCLFRSTVQLSSNLVWLPLMHMSPKMGYVCIRPKKEDLLFTLDVASCSSRTKSWPFVWAFKFKILTCVLPLDANQSLLLKMFPPIFKIFLFLIPNAKSNVKINKENH